MILRLRRTRWLSAAVWCSWLVLLVPANTRARIPRDERPIVRVIYRASNGFGQLSVTQRDITRTNVTITTYTFTDANGVTQVFEWNPQTGVMTMVFPTGYVYWRTLSSGIVNATFETATGQSWQVNFYADGSPVEQVDVDNLNAALQALAPGSSSAWSMFHDFAVTAGLIVDTGAGAVAVTQSARTTLGCAASVVGLAASYVGLAACVPLTAGLGCWAAIAGHAAAVTSLVTSCF